MILEGANYKGDANTPGWLGHCKGWAFASIAKAQPTGTTKEGITFSQDEMEGLWTELAEGATSGCIYTFGTPPDPENDDPGNQPPAT